jgi:MFS family permease
VLKRLAVDLTPLRKYPDFRLLWSSGLISYLGSMVTYVALPFQIKLLTNSYIAVGAIGAVELIPLIIFGLYGGVLADRVDRKKMIIITEFSCMLMVGTLFLNSQLEKPHLIWIYIVAGSFAALDGLQRPSADAILPRLVGHQDLPAASALMSLRWQMGVIIGPSIAGILLATTGVGSAYLVDILSFVLSLIFLARVRSVKPAKTNEAPTLTSLFEGIKYAGSRKDLMGTYIVDLCAMFFAMPNALFPFWADQMHARWALGLFYAAGTIGSVLVTLTSGWVKNYPHHGRAVMVAAIGWGAAITLAGISKSIFFVIFFLAAAGASDMISALFRGVIWNQSIPDELRGRLAGIELLSYSVGPLGGQMRAGGMAAWTNLRTSVISGGLLCIGFVSLAGSLLPDFRKYDGRTNKFAVEQRKIRESDANSPENSQSDQ